MSTRARHGAWFRKRPEDFALRCSEVTSPEAVIERWARAVVNRLWRTAAYGIRLLRTAAPR